MLDRILQTVSSFRFFTVSQFRLVGLMCFFGIHSTNIILVIGLLVMTDPREGRQLVFCNLTHESLNSRLGCRFYYSKVHFRFLIADTKRYLSIDSEIVLITVTVVEIKRWICGWSYRFNFSCLLRFVAVPIPRCGMQHPPWPFRLGDTVQDYQWICWFVYRWETGSLRWRTVNGFSLFLYRNVFLNMS